MMQARVNLITADPDRIVDTIGYIKTSVRPAVESMDGSLGLSLYANAEIGLAVVRSRSGNRAGAIHSEQMAAPRRTDVVHRAVGTVSVERYRVPVYEREAPLDTAVGLRLTGLDVDTGRIEDAVECFGATVVPRLAEAGGFCGALLLVDWDSGHSISETMWDSQKALAASRGEAAAVRGLETGRVDGRPDPGGGGVRPGVQHRAHRRGVTPRLEHGSRGRVRARRRRGGIFRLGGRGGGRACALGWRRQAPAPGPRTRSAQARGELIGQLGRDVGHHAATELRLLAGHLERVTTRTG